jgi:metal transporter CNNM
MKRVKEVMTDLDKCFMMELNTRLNFQIMLEIYKSGFTRIPIYKTTRPNVVGILFVKVRSCPDYYFERRCF